MFPRNLNRTLAGTVSEKHSRRLVAPRQFEIPTKYVNFAESDQEIVQMEDFVNDKIETNANMKTGVIAKSMATNKMMSGFDASWLSQNEVLSLKVGFYGTTPDMVLETENESVELAPVWRFFGSMEGTFRLYPSTQVAQAYDPAQRSWFRQAIADKSKTFISTPYEDAFGMGYGALKKVLEKWDKLAKIEYKIWKQK